MKRLLPCCIALATASCLMAQDEVSEDEKEDFKLLKSLVEVLDKASLSDVLEDRKRLQDLDLNDLPGAKEIVKEELQKLQASGVIPIEAIRNAVEGGLEGREETGSSSDLLGPEPKKGLKVAEEEVGGWLTVENSKSMVFDQVKSTMVCEGDVLVTDKGDGVENPFSLRCDKLVVHFKVNEEGERDLSSAMATGRMVVINGSNEKGEPLEARCKEAVFRDKTIILRGWPELTMPDGFIKAQDIDAYIVATTDKGSSEFTPHGAFQTKFLKTAEDEK